jgi:hypothetical protein
LLPFHAGGEAVAIMATIKQGMADVSAERLRYESSQELDELGEQGIIDPNVPFKYGGTATNKRDMHNPGKSQVLRVSVQRMCWRHETPQILYPPSPSLA